MRRIILLSAFSLIILVFLEAYALGENMGLSLKHAVELGILNNRDIIIEKYLHRMALERILEAKGIFDPVLAANLDAGKSEIPIAEVFYDQGFYKEEFIRNGLNLKGKVFTGADYGIDYFLETYKTNSQVVTMSPRYSTRLELSLIQPLLKEFGETITKTRIRIAEKGTEVSKWQVKDRVVKTVGSVEEAYWNLVYALETLNFHKEGVNLAKRLVAEVEVKVRAGELAPFRLIEAKSALASMEENVVSAENELKKGEQDLKLILGISGNPDGIIPLDRPREVERVPDQEEFLESAHKNRADLQASKSRVDQKKMEEKYMNNQLLPRLDFVGKYGKRGLSGTPNPVLWTKSLGKWTHPVLDTPFWGELSPWDALDDLYPSQGFDYWSLGLKLEIPLGNRAARGRYRQTRLERMKMEMEVKSLDEKIGSEVRKGILDIKTAIKMREAAMVTVEYAEEHLRAEEKRFKAGETTSYEVLKIQRMVTDAKTRHFRALIEYHKAWSKVRMAGGVSLSEYEIEFNEKMM